ncbi:MAG: GNAT family N-acetyltransferase [Clostridia bacterium]|nr:GNAT family N-acetyltransferase [Clostridia bacterium]
MEYKINECNYDIKKFIKDNICKEFNIDYWDEWLEKQDYECLKISPNILISVEDNNSLIGIGAVKSINNYECDFNTFYVKSDFRNKGIGNKIFDMCLEYIEKNGYKKITLCVDPKFVVARKIYEKNGFIFDYFDEEKQELYYHKYINKGSDIDGE